MRFTQGKTRAQVAGMLLALWPPLMSTVGALIGGIAFWIMIEHKPAPDPELIKWAFFGFTALYLLAWVVLLAQIIYVVFHILARNPRMDSNLLRAAWIVALLLMPYLVPIYWWRYLWHDPKPKPEDLAQVFT